MSAKLCIFFLVIFLCKFTRSRDYVNDILEFLKNILTFCVENENLIDVNLLFGVAIVSGQLAFVEKHNFQNELQHKITNINNLCEIIYKIAYQRNIANINSDQTQNLWLSPELWSFDHPSSYLHESVVKDYLHSDTIRDIDSKVFHTKYEFCVNSLIERCHLSQHCAQLILNDNGSGYILTHQILYLHALRQLHLKPSCSFNSPISLKALDDTLNNKCYRVLQQLNAIENEINRNATLLDLFTEEIVVCGLKNFLEFFKLKYINYILNANTSNVIRNRYDEIIGSAIHLMSVRMGAAVLYLKQFSKKHVLV